MKFIYTLSVTSRDGEEDLDQEEVERFARMMGIAIDGAATDCGVSAAIELVTVLP